MRNTSRNALLGWLVLGVTIVACGIRFAGPGGAKPTSPVAATVFALQTSLSASQTALADQLSIPTATPQPSATNTSAPASPTPRQTVVKTTALCSTGPGSVYDVVSSVKAGTPVQLLGIGSKSGWFVIENPTYHDRCWIEAKNLDVDPNLNLTTLKVFNPPPTPGPTPEPSPTP